MSEVKKDKKEKSGKSKKPEKDQKEKSGKSKKPEKDKKKSKSVKG